MRLPKIPKLVIGPYRELQRPKFPVDRSLVSRQLRAAELHPVNGIKRVLIEDQPDTFVEPVDFERLPV